MKAHYAVRAFCRGLVADETEKVVLDSGVNVFSVVTEDIDGLTARLVEQGAEIQGVDRLDALDPVEPVGERMQQLGLDVDVVRDDAGGMWLPATQVRHDTGSGSDEG